MIRGMSAYAPPFPRVSDPLDRARRYAEGNLRGTLSLNELADASGLSPYHFSRLFTGRYGLALWPMCACAGWKPRPNACGLGARSD